MLNKYMKNMIEKNKVGVFGHMKVELKNPKRRVRSP